MPVPTVAFFWLRDFHSGATKCPPLLGFLRIAPIADSHMMMRFGIEDEDAGVSWSHDSANHIQLWTMNNIALYIFIHVRFCHWNWMKLNEFESYLFIFTHHYDHWQGPYRSNCRSIEMFMLMFMLSVAQLSCPMLVRGEQWQEVSSLSMVWSVPWSGHCPLRRGWYENSYKKDHTKGHYKMIHVYTNMMKQRGSKGYIHTGKLGRI